MRANIRLGCMERVHHAASFFQARFALEALCATDPAPLRVTDESFMTMGNAVDGEAEQIKLA